MTTQTLNFSSPRHLSQLYCGKTSNLNAIEQAFEVEIVTRNDWLKIDGPQQGVKKTESLFEILELARKQGMLIGESDFIHMLQEVSKGNEQELRDTFKKSCIIKIKNKSIVPKSPNQKRYLQFINKHDVVLGIGPAGTGKTYLAVAAAFKALLENSVDKIILTRPAVEAGEALGFLPGDLREKILPYLRPLYDAMYDIIGREETVSLLEKEIIEIAPLAYMRGRTLSNAFVILDEAQNTTSEQMMMFLTRLGDRSKMVITGDITQVDLPKHQPSGLKQAVHVLSGIQDIKLFYFESQDIIRHPVVQKIIDAYERYFSNR